MVLLQTKNFQKLGGLSNKEHHLIEKAKEGVKEGVENLKEKEKKFGLTDKIGAGLLAVASTLKKIAAKLRGGSKSDGEDKVSPADHDVSDGMNEYEKINKSDVVTAE